MTRINVQPTTPAELQQYLENLITEKGQELHHEIEIPEADGHFNFTYSVLIDYIVAAPQYHRTRIHSELVSIDFHDGDVFRCLHALAGCVLNSFNQPA